MGRLGVEVEPSLLFIDGRYLFSLCVAEVVVERRVGFGHGVDQPAVETPEQKVPGVVVGFVAEVPGGSLPVAIPVVLLASGGHARQTEGGDVDDDGREAEQDLQTGVQH